MKNPIVGRVLVLAGVAALMSITYSNCSAPTAASFGLTTASRAAAANSTPVSVSPSAQPVGFDQEALFVASGGTPPYSYAVSNGCGTIGSDGTFYGADSLPTGTTDTSVTCQVTVSDSAGNSGSATITLTSLSSADATPTPTPVPLVATYSPTTVVAGAAVTFSISGGTPSYSVTVLSGGATVSGNVVTTGITPGPVSVQVADSAGQTTSVSFTTLTCAPNSSTSCLVNNGTGQQTCNASGTGYGACTVTACNAPAVLNNNSCVRGYWDYSANQPRNGMESCEGTNLPYVQQNAACSTFGQEGCGPVGGGRNASFGLYTCMVQTN